MKRWFKWLFLLLTVLLCIGGGLFLWQSGFFAAAGSQESLRAYIVDFSPYSHLCFFLIQFLSVILAPIPSNISALAGGVLFGTWVSFLLTFSAVTAGSLLVFSLARGLGRDAVTRLVGRKVSEKYLDVIHAKTDIFLVLAFLFPFFPDDVLCILAGLTQISFRRFAGIILCTRPWGLLFASALGGASFSIPAWGMALIGAACGGTATLEPCVSGPCRTRYFLFFFHFPSLQKPCDMLLSICKQELLLFRRTTCGTRNPIQQKAGSHPDRDPQFRRPPLR